MFFISLSHLRYDYVRYSLSYQCLCRTQNPILADCGSSVNTTHHIRHSKTHTPYVSLGLSHQRQDQTERLGARQLTERNGCGDFCLLFESIIYTTEQTCGKIYCGHASGFPPVNPNNGKNQKIVPCLSSKKCKGKSGGCILI